MEPEIFNALSALIQWLVIPALAWAWALNKRVNSHAEEIRVIAELMKERRMQREEDRDQMREALHKLDNTISKLATKIDDFGRLSARVDAIERKAEDH